MIDNPKYTDILCYNANKEYMEKYRILIETIKESIQLTREQEEFYLKGVRMK